MRLSRQMLLNFNKTTSRLCCSFVLGAVSPAVVVPSMLLLQKDGYGVEQGIPTLLMAAGSFDDILAITGFTTCLGVAFATGILSKRDCFHCGTPSWVFHWAGTRWIPPVVVGLI